MAKLRMGVCGRRDVYGGKWGVWGRYDIVGMSI